MRPRTRVKICGIRTYDAAIAAVEAGADAVGFVFVRRSPRYIEPAEAAAVMASLPPFVSSVGLFQNCPIEEFIRIEEACPTHLTQLHGTEPVDLVRQCGPAIKAVRFNEQSIDDDLSRWERVDEVEAILVDGSWGGEGVAFDWPKLLEPASKLTKPLILAGGLTPENVGEAIHRVRPFAVDVSSGVEREPGVKDAAKIRAFCEAVRAADASQ